MPRMKIVESASRISVRDDGTLRLAVVADTHSAPHRATLGHLRAIAPDAILHAGDIGDLDVLDDLEKVAPLFAVRGNIDGYGPSIPDVRTLDLMSGESSIARILLLHIAVNGPRLRADAARLARARDASLVVCGHSHIPLIARDSGVAIFNPGSAGPRRFQLPIVFGVIEVSPAAIRLTHIDCATGLPWAPGRAA